ncbi:MAG TPA: response regulator transcription factor [Bryobacteraceae bacterium]|nr:response regulator transcription factor [Bryobacteraceae bacterium]
MPRRILLVDDHPAVLTRTQELLSTSFQGTVFGHASNIQQSLELVLREPWDIAIVDLSLLGGNITTIRELKKIQPAMKVLVFSMYSAEQFAKHVKRAGADAYLSKDRPAEEIVATVGRLLRSAR